VCQNAYVFPVSQTHVFSKPLIDETLIGHSSAHSKYLLMPAGLKKQGN